MQLSIGPSLTFSYLNLQFSLDEVGSLLGLHDKLTGRRKGKPKQELEALKRAGIILGVTAWETYIEGVFPQFFSYSKHSCESCKSELERAVQTLNNPNSKNISRLSKRYFRFDVSDHWSYGRFSAEMVRRRLDHFIGLRHRAVHSMKRFPKSVTAVRRTDLVTIIPFLRALGERTESALRDRFEGKNVGT